MIRCDVALAWCRPWQTGSPDFQWSSNGRPILLRAPHSMQRKPLDVPSIPPAMRVPLIYLPNGSRQPETTPVPPVSVHRKSCTLELLGCPWSIHPFLCGLLSPAVFGSGHVSHS